MQIGAVLPQTEIGTDVSSLRDYVQAVQDLGYQHLVTSDHVLGANPDGHPGWTRPQRHTTVVHEPFVLFGFIAGVAPKLGLLSNVVIMPQRQTVLVAKQAAQVDILAEGTLSARPRDRLEPRRVRGAQRELQEPCPPLRGAGRPDAQALERPVDLVPGPVPHRHGGRDLPAADPAPDPDLGRRAPPRPPSSGPPASPTATCRSPRSTARARSPRRSSGSTAGCARPAATRPPSASSRA